MKLNITPGPWKYLPLKFNTDNREDVSTGSITSTFGEPVWFIAEMQNSCVYHKLEDHEESECNAIAIINAVNNTYHAGIDPEVVPEMLKFISAIAGYLNKNGILDGFIINDAKKLIKKATL